MAQELESTYLDLLRVHTSIRRVERAEGIVLIGPDTYLVFDDDAGRQLQSRILRDLDVFLPLVTVLLRGQSDVDRGKLGEHSRRLRQALEPHKLIWWDDSLEKVEEQVVAALRGIVALLNGCYDPSAGCDIYVPDTNALLHNPALESWRFPGVPRFVIALVPAVLGELDRLKIEHRNEAVRQKAERLIRTIKGFRNRGLLIHGVPLVKGISEVVGVAAEPDFNQTLPWLDASVADDRLLAATIEVMRSRSRSMVTLVTRDLNLQTKAEYARVPFVEPPDQEVTEN